MRALNFIKRSVSVLLIILIPFNQISWAGDVIELQEGHFQAVVDPWQKAVAQAVKNSAESFESDFPLSAPPPENPLVNVQEFNQFALSDFDELFKASAQISSLSGNDNPSASVEVLSPEEINFHFNLSDGDDSASLILSGWVFTKPEMDPKNISISLSNGALKISTNGVAGVTYQMEYSTDLTHWEVAKTGLHVDSQNKLSVLDDGSLIASNGTHLLHPFQSGVPRRFYRFSMVDGFDETYVGKSVDVGNVFNIGLNGPANKQVTLQIFDVNNKKLEAVLNLTGANQNYSIDLSQSGLDVSRIATIRLVASKETTGSTGDIHVFIHGISHGAWTRTLANGDVITVENDLLKEKRFSNGDKAIYASNGEITEYRFANGNNIRYLNDSIEIIKSDGTLLKRIGKDKPIVPNFSLAVKMTLEGGMEAYYSDGNLIGLKMVNGTILYNLRLSEGATPEILDATILRVDGTFEVIWNQKRMRSIYSDGSIVDYFGDESIAHEINQNIIKTYHAFGLSDLFLKIVASSGSFSSYDSKGILREVQGEGKKYFYAVRQQGNELISTIDPNFFEPMNADVLVGGTYSLQGELKELRFHDGRKVIFENGRIKQTLDAQGNVAQFSNIEIDGLLGQSIARNGTRFIYDSNGFLSQIQTPQGTITREQTGNDPNHIQLILDAVGGYQLTDFELDTDGKILNGIVQTREGIKQKIENGVLREFETADGRKYTVNGDEASLVSWTFQDGTVVKYGNVGIQQILFPDHSRLDQIELTNQQEIQSYIQTDIDGTRRFFRNGQLQKIITPQGVQIFYNAGGYAEKIIRADGREEALQNQFDAENRWVGVRVIGGHDIREYDQEGELINLITAGVTAQIQNNQIKVLSTRFGNIANPSFSADGKLSGAVVLADERVLTVENGVLKKVTFKDGVWVGYQNGRINSVHTSEADYTLTYVESGGVTQDIQVNWQRSSNQPIFHLIQEVIPMIKRGSPQIVNFSELNKAIYFDGDDSLLINGGHALNLGMGDFTVDFHVNFESIGEGQPQTFIYRNNIDFRIARNGNNHLEVHLNGSAYDFGEFRPQTNRNYHLAVVRKNGQIKFYIDGKAQPFAYESVQNLVSTGPMVLGAAGNEYYFRGKMDEFRISDIARWDSDFTFSTASYEVDGHTRFLHHMNDFERAQAGRNEVTEALPISGSQSLATYLLGNPQSVFSKIISPRSADDIFDEGGARLQLGDGENSVGHVDLSAWMNDSARNSIYSLSGFFNPNWNGVEQGDERFNGGYLARNYQIGPSPDNLGQVEADYLDMDGDGDLDRVYLDESTNFWWVQKFENGSFKPAEKWEGIKDVEDSRLSSYFYTLRWYEGKHPVVLGDLVDMNGDGRPDRVYTTHYGDSYWYVAMNNGHGFDPAQIWDLSIQPTSQWSFQATYAIRVRDDDGGNGGIESIQPLIADLIDLDGDGLPDRVVRPLANPNPGIDPYDHWFFQKNNGHGFESAVIWTGVDHSFYNDAKIGGSLSWYIKKDSGITDISDLKDLDGDGRLDRVLLKHKISDDPNSGFDWYWQKNNCQQNRREKDSFARAEFKLG